MVKITEEMLAAKRAKSERMSRFNEQMGGPNDYNEPDWSGFELQDGSKMRLDYETLNRIRNRPNPPPPETLWTMINEFERLTLQNQGGGFNPRKLEMEKAPKLIRATIRKEEGTALFKAGKYSEALEKYLAAIHFLLDDASGTKATVPSPTFFPQKYYEIGSLCSQGSWMEYIDMLALTGNVAQCYKNLGNHVKTIDWLQEGEMLMLNQRHGMLKNQPSWKDHHLNLVDYWVLRVKNQLRQYYEFSALGNTSSATHFASEASGNYLRPDSSKYPRLRAMKSEFELDNLSKMFGHRHPEPNLLDKTPLVCPEIQVRGIWEKLSYASGPRPSGRCAHSSWIWKGRLYICGGVNENQMELQDKFWRLDLATGVWTQLKNPPTKLPVAGLSSIRPMRVWKDKAYLFVGTLTLLVFDLKSENWSSLKTSVSGGKAWPYSADYKYLTAFNTTLLDDKLYVFGGDDNNTYLGQNIFLALDLNTNQWDHISGTTNNIPQTFEPNLRTLPSMWAVPDQRKIYIMHGSANRTQAKMKHKPGAGEYDYMYTDLWSFSVDERKWERERLRGNFPSPRTETGSDYCNSAGRAVVYGGYHGSMKTLEMKSSSIQTGLFDFAFFGDTFVYDPKTKLWQHVLVSGFPSYRAMASIICDPDTGKIYLFGGYTNSDFVPAKNFMSRVYYDLWQLKLDMPGGHWNPEDLQRDIRAERMGPWMRCFSCGNCGITWRKCAGSCGGKYYFCSKECQRDGWKEHKQKHGCRKI